ncbi:MAG: HlyD family efflux transporter periplasmic adaptor subunit [Inquilinus sp.]|nr:HlyD family efflux transporter periplasmic adaptor subunit [Inquilinus sp.]
MRFLVRGIVGLLLFALTAGFVAIGVIRFMSADDAEESGRPGDAQERAFVVNVSTLERVTAEPVITAYGEVRSWRTLELRAATGGRVVELSDGFRDGAAVAAGTLLFAIDPAEAQARLADAEVALLDASAEEAEAREALTVAEADLVAAETQRRLRVQALERQRDLQRRDFAAAVAVEEAELAVANAEQTVASRTLALVTARNRIDRASRAIERAAITRDEAARILDETRVTAEFDGLLSDVDAAIGRRVSANERLGMLIDLTALEVAFRVSHTQFARLLEDRTLRPSPIIVALDLDGTNVEIGGHIERVGAIVQTGDTGRIVYAKLDAGRDTILRPGDFVTVRVAEPPLADVAVIPATAADSAGRLLVVNDDDRLEEVAATILRRQGDTLIVGSVPFGARYVTERTPQLGPGIKVRPVDAARAADGSSAALPTPIGTAVGTSSDRVVLNAEQRQSLIEILEADRRMPQERRDRLRNLLSQPEVPRGLVERLQLRGAGGG